MCTSVLTRPLSIERDDPIQRARQTAALTRVVLGVLGVVLILAKPEIVPTPACGIAGFTIIVITALLQLAELHVNWVAAEESFAASAGVLIIGLGDQSVTIVSMLWLVALA